MKTKIKVSMAAICSHATPDGKAIMGRKQYLEKKLQWGDLSEEEQRELASLRAAVKTTKSKKDFIKADILVATSVCGRIQWVKESEYKRLYEPLGFRRLS